MSKENLITNSNVFRIRVKSEKKEVEVQIPLSERDTIGMESDGVGYKAIRIVESLVKELNKLD